VTLTCLPACRESLEGHLVGRSPNMPGYVWMRRWLRRELCRRHQQAPKIGSLHGGWESWSGLGHGVDRQRKLSARTTLLQLAHRFALRKQFPQIRQSDGPLAPHCCHCALGTIVTVCTVVMGKKRKAAADGVDGAPESRKRSRSEKAEKFNGNATDRKGLVYHTPSVPT
jgi:hypothetical protein